MKKLSDYRSLVVVVLLLGAVGLVAVAVGCFGGDEGSPDTTMNLTPNSDVSPGTTSAVTDGMAVASAEQLSTFRSKDPFIPQALVITTTTKATTTTIATTTTTRPPTTTTRRPTTTTSSSTSSTSSTTSTTVAPTYSLRLDVIWPPPVSVNFWIDTSYVRQSVGAVVTGPFGRVEVMAIDTTSIPNTATFRLNDGELDFTLQVGQSQTL